MRLTWKDGAATVMVAGTVASYVAFLADVSLPLVAGTRSMATALLVLGLVGCALGGASMPAEDSPKWNTVVAALFGAATAVALVATWITASGFALAVAVGGTVVLWLVATARHAFTGAGPHPRAAVHY